MEYSKHDITLKKRTFKGLAIIRKACKGFTLIEVLMVVGIIALLIVIAIGTYRAQLLKGFDGKRKADINKIKIALEEYEKDHECYPTIDEISCTPGDGLRPYLSKIPCEPNSTESYVYYPDNASCPKWYWIFTALDSETGPGCEYGCGPTADLRIYDFYGSSPNADKPYENDAPTPAPTGQIQYTGRFKCVNSACLPEVVGDNCDPNYGDPSCGGGMCAYSYNNCGN
jgi:prepilin-type N-terminal cleavage/methylation domain-containing protein